MSNGETLEERGVMRLLVRWLVRRYYPRIEISNADRIPQTGPVLLCANHGNSLIDPVLIGVAAVRPVGFMAKAPLFEFPVVGRVMHALGMIPAFRGSDDAKQVRKNFESLEVGANVLVEGRAMGIFPEGKSTDQAHLEMIRSGAARMALQAVEDGAEGLQVVPIGITYERKEHSRSSAWVQVGEPIDVSQLLNEHDGDLRKARRAFTSELESRLKDVVVHLDEPEWEPLLTDLETLVPPPDATTKTAVPALRQRKRLANAMNHFLETDRPRAESVAQDITSYRNNVESAGLRLNSPVLCQHGIMAVLTMLWSVLKPMLLAIPAFAGTLHHIVPFVVVRGIASRLDQPGQKTVSTNRMLVGLPIYILWYAAVAWWMFAYFATWFAWTWMIAAPFCALISLTFWRQAGATVVLLWHRLRATLQRQQLKQLLQQRSELSQQLTDLSDEYAKIAPRPEPETRQSRKGLIARTAGIIFLLLVAASIMWIAKYWFLDNPTHSRGLDLANLSSRKLDANLARDEKALLPIIAGFDTLETAALKLKEEFESGERSYDKQGDNDAVRELMRRYMTYRQALLRIIWKYQSYTEVSNEDQRLRTFLLDFTAASVLYEASMKFVYGFEWRREAVDKLNEPEPNWGIPPGLYDSIRSNLASRENLHLFALSQEFYRTQNDQQAFEKHGLSKSKTHKTFHRAITDSEKTLDKIAESLGLRIVEVAYTDAAQLLQDAQYQTQSAISTWIGDFKIREPRNGESLIDKQQLKKLRSILRPGDILLERRNWYLSNAFLPGFWPHGAVYVGTAQELRDRGIDGREYISKHLDAFAQKDHEGNEHVIIEAVSEGVIFSSLEHSIGGADSVAVLRPNLTEEQKNEAIERAFSFAGRPYDFEFDFETPSALVCTEVVYRTYGGNSGPIKFPLVRIMGRTTMPANKLVEKYRDEEQGPAELAQFEFIAFIDGDEEGETSQFITDKQAFIDTLNRSGTTFRKAGSRWYAIKSIGPLGWVLLSLIVICSVTNVVTNLTSQIRRKRATKSAT